VNIRPLHDRGTEVKVDHQYVVVMREDDVMAIVD
jgi:co-chaperonin GroES (HSP10)